ncbi:carbohydrate kinase family protein [Planctomyces sp. SH-PL62]|uniref:carbohydrate kinase family protein n=1 Tax=Planctomyces sp. SH-PL62 TaxID=1636152 RepID=UPI00078B7057|nr:carbohydrate kinase family protein [Planctomyces sp. SH-PL62]AMV37265.1 putative sugar kinase YdjH [Planctomyces sp. SH-PL62]
MSTSAAPAPRPPVVSAGMVLVDHLTPPISHMPKPGELIAVDQLYLNIGGGAANTSMALGRLGVPVSVSARIGDDAFGRFIVESLESGGVGTGDIKVDPERETSQTLIVNVQGEDRRFIHTLGANRGYVPADMDDAIAVPPRVLHIGYFLIVPQLDGEGLALRLDRVQKAGGHTILDVVTPGPGDYVEPLRKVLPFTDVFVPNTDEAALILGETDPIRQARAFREMGARRVVVTMGDRGLVSISEENEVRLGSFPVTFVDGTGGGDAFNAGYIVGLLEGKSELDCLTLASAVGASCVREVGATPGVFRRHEADEFLARHSLPIERLA